ncbi:pentatricopeptide repeat-containing protein At1g07740, mitochondrial-like [Zingiber officinale]|uniref:Pentatricopeptide repeat-containing protein n=1 Tax=Zingiber officinale TaxID=94328 RepID=A0A8J5FS63_ZINOF|nr:pentatricopeptide repeat-containing protein At1g07740, mitochondrial-like [Zingiber officinale]KAG6492864.1 hypothetical protein ZIOFF_047832 [Zingiber officinale]
MLRRRPPSFKHRRGPQKPSPTRTLIPLLKKLKSTADPAAALRQLQHADPDLLTYPVCSSLLYRLAKARLVPEIDSLLALLRAHRVPCKEAAFNSLIRRFGSDGLPDRAVDLFHGLRSFEFSTSAPSVQSLNSALAALVENCRFEQARALLAQSAATFGLRANAVSYNILIQGCCAAEGSSSARLLFDEMLQKGIRPTVVTYNVLIGHSAKNGDLGTGARLKEEMVRRGVQPNAITFALLMDALCREGNYAAAKKMMFDMEYQGCKAGLVNYGVLMSDRGRRGDLDGARALLAEMKRRKLKPDVPIYGALINYLCGAGRTAEAYAVLVEMQVEGGCEPNAAAYRMMADGACRAGDFEMASRVLTAMLASGHYPREETLRCLMNGLCGIGKVEAACTVLEEMARREMELDGNGWKALVEATFVPAEPKKNNSTRSNYDPNRDPLNRV